VGVSGEVIGDAIDMAASILAFIQFDDNTPKGEHPFSCEPSTWSLEWDIGFYGCKDYRFIAAISGMRAERGKKPLIPLRGFPPTFGPGLELIKDEPLAGWLTHSEILSCLDHFDIAQSDLHDSVLNVLQAMKQLKEKYGNDRVRLVFAISD
jgi:hypothetical protein